MTVVVLDGRPIDVGTSARVEWRDDFSTLRWRATTTMTITVTMTTAATPMAIHFPDRVLETIAIGPGDSVPASIDLIIATGVRVT
jgi:hypothetical protein